MAFERMQQLRGTAAEATAANVVLLAGEIGVETDTGKMKTGDGVSAWVDLPYSNQVGTVVGDASQLTGVAPLSVIPDLSAKYVPRYTQINVVADHGADNTGATSAVGAFNAAIASANLVPQGKVEVLMPPGTYDLTAGGLDPILRHYVTFVGGGRGVTTLNVKSGTLFTWGNGQVGTFPTGGGMRDASIVCTNPDVDQRLFYVNRAAHQIFEGLFLDNVRQLARLGDPDSDLGASSPTLRSIVGATDPTAGSVVIDAAHGTGLFLSAISLHAKGVGFPTNATDPHPAQDTTFLRFGQGSWDTVLAVDVISNRYNRGLDINADSLVFVSNMWYTNCVFDYNKTSGIRLRTQSGGNIRSVYFNGCWAVASDAHSVEVAAISGALINIHFTDTAGRQAGKNNWRFYGPALEKVFLTSCTGMGANRFAATNVGSEQDDLVILGSGVTVRGGSFGEDGASYTGFACQGRYGVNVSPNLAATVTDVESDGVTGAWSVSACSTASRRRRITGNRCYDGSAPAYARAQPEAAPASGVLNTHQSYMVATLHIYGGTVSSVEHNGVVVGTSGPAVLRLNPGDTWAMTYTAAPSLSRVVHP